MSFLELQNQAIQLPVAEKVALIEQLTHSISATELEAFWIAQAEKITQAVDAGQMQVFTSDELRKRRAARTTS